MMSGNKARGDAYARLLDAAGRGFRSAGFGGAAVDALAKRAGLTSGAFYAHFGSKADAFQLAVADGISFLGNAIAAFRARHGADWRDSFVDFYFGERMGVGLDEACALPSFTADVARANVATRKAYETQLDALVESIAGAFGDKSDRQRAWAFLAILSGAAGMARAVKDARLRNEILDSARKAAKAL
jgi:AcrR family transcriptional regulator